MAIPLPNLDTKNFAQLMEEAKALIPRFSRNWTDFNPSDPGITLLELFAWINEMIIYRQNQLSRETKWQLLQMLFPPRETASIEMFFKVENGSELILPPGLQIIYKEYGNDSNTNNTIVTKEISFENPRYIKLTKDGSVTFYNVGASHSFDLTAHTGSEGTKNQRITLLSSDNGTLLGKKPLVYHHELNDVANTYRKVNEPILLVNGTRWWFVPNLVENDYLISIPENTSDQEGKTVFTIDYHLRALVFGDGSKTAIPSSGATLRIENLVFSDGDEARVPVRVNHIHDENVQYPPWTISLSKLITDGNQTNYSSQSEISTAFQYNITPTIGGSNWYTGPQGQPLYSGENDDLILEEALRDCLAFHRSQSRRTVTEGDFEAAVNDARIIVRYTDPTSENETLRDYSIDRVWCLENYNIDYDSSENDSNPEVENAHKNHLSVILVCKDLINNVILNDSVPDNDKNDLTEQMNSAVLAVLEKKRQLTTRLHVGFPTIILVNINIKLSIKHEFASSEIIVREKIRTSLIEYFDIVDGANNGRGWMPGQGLYESEIYTVLEKMDQVDMTHEVAISIVDTNGPATLREILPEQLIMLNEISIQIVS